MKVAIIYNFSSSAWKSCKRIVPNLLNSYKKMKGQYEVKEFNYESESLEKIDLLASEIYSYCPTHTIFIDHRPSTPKFLLFYFSAFKSLPSNLIIHIFGDFTLDLKDWLSIRPQLEVSPCKFVCASYAQNELLKKNFCGDHRNIFFCPFPVDTQVFYFDQKLSNAKEEKDQFKILYTGRVSEQKNIIKLMKVFDSFKEKFIPHSKLRIAGPFDDISYPYLGQYSPLNNYYFKFSKNYLELSQATQESIEYLGNLEDEKLAFYYNTSDVYFSLSTHNDEDFGMSPAEAACCGLPLALSSWGGFKSFASHLETNTVEQIAVKKNQGRFGISSNESMLKLFKISSQIINREKLAAKAQAIFSIDACSTRLKEILFSNFYPLSKKSSYIQAIAREVHSKELPFLDIDKKGFSSFYFEFYTSYWRGESERA